MNFIESFSTGLNGFRHIYQGCEALFMEGDVTDRLPLDPSDIYDFRTHKIGITALGVFSTYPQIFSNTASPTLLLSLSIVEIGFRIADIIRLIRLDNHTNLDFDYARHTSILHLINIGRLILISLTFTTVYAFSSKFLRPIIFISQLADTTFRLYTLQANRSDIAEGIYRLYKKSTFDFALATFKASMIAFAGYCSVEVIVSLATRKIVPVT